MAARPSIWVRLALSPGALRIEVHDAGTDRPFVRTATEDDESGRGLWLVQQLSARWGCCPRPGGVGKAVWCVVAPETGGRADAAAAGGRVEQGREREMGKGRADAAAEGGPVVVEIEDVTAPAVFTRLPDALAAVWESMRVLPLGVVQADAFRYFLTRPEAVERVAGFLGRDGELSLSFSLEGRIHSVRLRPARR